MVLLFGPGRTGRQRGGEPLDRSANQCAGCALSIHLFPLRLSNQAGTTRRRAARQRRPLRLVDFKDCRTRYKRVKADETRYAGVRRINCL